MIALFFLVIALVLHFSGAPKWAEVVWLIANILVPDEFPIIDEIFQAVILISG